MMQAARDMIISKEIGKIKKLGLNYQSVSEGKKLRPRSKRSSRSRGQSSIDNSKLKVINEGK